MGRFNFGDSREWAKAEDERNDRAVTERPVTAKENFDSSRDGNAQVEAVPGAWWRPGSRN